MTGPGASPSPALDLAAAMLRGPGRYRTSWTPAEIIDYHAGLRERHRHPSSDLLMFYRGFAEVMTEISDGKQAEAIFYPYWSMKEHGSGWERRWCAHIAKQLFTARTYQITAEMMDVVDSAHRAHSGDRKLQHLSELDLPAETGFAFFDKPWAHLDIKNAVSAIRAVSWSTETARIRRTEDAEPEPVSCVRLMLWGHFGDDDDVMPLMRAKLGSRERIMTFLGELSMIHAIIIPFDIRFPWLTGEESPAAFVQMLWVFLGMEIATARRARVPRHAARRALRSIRHDQVDVITLRRTKHGPPPEGYQHQDIDWSCRWIVQPHWRHLSSYEAKHHAATPDAGIPGPDVHCAVRGCGTRITYIKSYIKGPDGKPLRHAEQLYRLAR